MRVSRFCSGALLLGNLHIPSILAFSCSDDRGGGVERRAVAKESAVLLVSLLLPGDGKNIMPTVKGAMGVSLQELVVPSAYAEELDHEENCNEKCLAERKRIVEERRAMMRQSRTTTKRQDVFELSQQRAAMYNTSYRGIQCPPQPANGVTVPCI